MHFYSDSSDEKSSEIMYSFSRGNKENTKNDNTHTLRKRLS